MVLTRMKTSNSLFALSLIVWTLGCVSSADAQLPLEVGEEVKIQFFTGDWIEGTVLEKRGAGWLVEYRLSKEVPVMRDLFARNQIRKLCEADAIDFSRRWESSNGNFQIDAALKNFVGDLEEVILIKTDLKELQVKVSSLSAKDIAYLTKFYKSRGAAANIGALPAVIPDLPELTEFVLDSANTPNVLLGGDGDLAPLGALPSFLQTFQQAGVGFPKVRAEQKVVAMIPVGGPEQLVLVTANENSFFNEQAPFQSQGYWVSLKQKKVVNLVAVSPDSQPVDYDPRHKMLLTVRSLRFEGIEGIMAGLIAGEDPAQPNENKLLETNVKSALEGTGEYVLWRLQPGDSKVEPLIRWHAPMIDGIFSPFAKIINDKVILAQVGRDTYQAWNLETKREIFTFKPSSPVPQNIVLTPDRQSIIVSEEKRVLVINAENGEMRFALPIPEELATAANVDSSGTKLAAVTTRFLYVWDLASKNREPIVYPAPLIGHPFHSRLDWVDDDHVLIEGIGRRVLYRLSLKFPIWSYTMDDRHFNNDPLISGAVGKLFFYMAEEAGGIFSSGSVALGAVNLPGPRVDQLTEAAMGEDMQSMCVLKPGVHVDIKIGSVTDPEQVTQWLKEKIAAAGWVYQEGSSLEIQAEMGTLPTRDETYKQLGGRGANTNTISISRTPYFASIRIVDRERLIWRAGSLSGIPFFRSTDNLQNTIDEQQVPQLDFFRRVEFEPVVLDPEYSNGFGVSKFGAKGIEVVSVTPPGRADDPWAAAEEMERQLEEDAKPPSVNPDGSEKN